MKIEKIKMKSLEMIKKVENWGKKLIWLQVYMNIEIVLNIKIAKNESKFFKFIIIIYNLYIKNYIYKK
jgi:hypothetical protein